MVGMVRIMVFCGRVVNGWDGKNDEFAGEGF